MDICHYRYSSPEQCSDKTLRTLYGMNDSAVLTEETANAYAQVIANYEEIYGEAHEVKEEGLSVPGLYGVGYINLLDLDGDGLEELLIGYMDRADNYYREGVDVWTMHGNQAEKIHENALCSGGDAGSSNVGVLYENGTYYLCSIFDGGAFSAEYYAMKDGKLTVVHTANDDYNEVLIDGRPVSEEEFKAEEARNKRVWRYPLYNKEFSNQRRMLNTMKSIIVQSSSGDIKSNVLVKETEAEIETETEIETEKSVGEYILPNSSSAYLNQEDVKNLSAEELRIARNEIYARHGRKFQTQDLQDYFNSKAWYHGTIEPADFTENMLNDIEKKNAEFLKKQEENAP